MNFREIQGHLNSFASERSESFALSGNDFLIRIDASRLGEVFMVLWLALYRRNSRSPAFITPSLSLYCSRLSSTPVDDLFLQSLHGVPKDQAHAIVAYRQRMNGHVSFQLFEPPDDRFAELGPLSNWDEVRLLNCLSGTLKVTQEFGGQTHWPQTAEDLMSWARSRLASKPALIGLYKQSQLWSVATKA